MSDYRITGTYFYSDLEDEAGNTTNMTMGKLLKLLKKSSTSHYWIDEHVKVDFLLGCHEVPHPRHNITVLFLCCATSLCRNMFADHLLYLTAFWKMISWQSTSFFFFLLTSNIQVTPCVKVYDGSGKKRYKTWAITCTEEASRAIWYGASFNQPEAPHSLRQTGCGESWKSTQKHSRKRERERERERQKKRGREAVRQPGASK